MPFSPDIVVTSPDARILLIAEAKRRPEILREDEAELKSYMIHMKCPIGLLVTPDAIEVFRDRYTGRSEASVERVETFAAPTAWEIFRVPHQGSTAKEASRTQLALRFEEIVRNWLERLGSSSWTDLDEFPKETKEALQEYVLPALTEGVVRSGGRRESPNPY